MDVQDGITDDYFDAVLASDGIAVRMSDNVALILAQLVGRLVQTLESGEPVKALRRMFPDAYRSRGDARGFRERHAAALRDTTAARCVLARCTSATQHVINHAEVDAWVATLGLARLLDQSRHDTRPGMTGTWLTYMQECLVVAVNPRLGEFAGFGEQGPRTIRGR
jgi:hypothetical protein